MPPLDNHHFDEYSDYWMILWLSCTTKKICLKQIQLIGQLEIHENCIYFQLLFIYCMTYRLSFIFCLRIYYIENAVSNFVSSFDNSVKSEEC